MFLEIDDTWMVNVDNIVDIKTAIVEEGGSTSRLSLSDGREITMTFTDDRLAEELHELLSEGQNLDTLGNRAKMYNETRIKEIIQQGIVRVLPP